MESVAQGDHAVDVDSRGRRRRRDEHERAAAAAAAALDVERLRAMIDAILNDEELRHVREEEERSDPETVESIRALHIPVAGDGETREEECAICLDDFVPGGPRGLKQLRMMPCSHSFHQRCIFRWLQINRRCPLCRFAMPSGKRRRLLQPDDDQQQEAPPPHGSA